jgi:glutamate-1-semialdehyde 2,1-aminomutase
MAFGHADHFDGTPSTGVAEAVADNVILVDPNDREGLRRVIEQDADTIAAAILEPTGSSFGQIPIASDFVALLRELTTANGILLIFDEVVTGFRVSPGGAQAALGIMPDLATLAKILAGGLPGGAVAGRSDVLGILDHDYTAETGRERMQHPGTFNANPLSAAAGCATLRIIRDTDACDRATAYAERLRQELTNILVSEGVDWAAYGSFSAFHLFANSTATATDPRTFDPLALAYAEFKRNKSGSVMTKLSLAMRVNGVDIAGWPGGPVSAVHDDRDLDHTVSAFQESIRLLRQEGELST